MRKPFQEASVRWAVERLCDPLGSRRVLVADEVGLGKTRVAQGVIMALAARSNLERPLRVFYVCSSLTIARQNERSLLKDLHGPEKEAARVRAERLGLLLNAKQGTATVPRFTLFTITPGTSTKAGTGSSAERVTLARCVWKAFAFRADDWFHEAFHVGVEIRNWHLLWSSSSAPSWFNGTLLDRFIRHVGARFEASGVSLNDVVRSELRDSKTRWQAVARLRSALILAIVAEVRPDLVIFDEFQRFFSMLPIATDSLEGADAEYDEQSHAIVKTLLEAPDEEGPSPGVLMLSATPYRMYSRMREANEHHRELYQLVAFLFGRAGPAQSARLKQEVAEYRACLEREPVGSVQVISAKRAVEARLRPVMVRTERGALLGYTEASAGGMAMQHVAIEPNDARAFVHLAASAAEPLRSMSEPFWSSIPFALQMMPANDYAFRKRAVPARLPRGEQNLKVRAEAVRRYERVAFTHPRLRGLASALPASLLALPWMPPSLPWWPLGGCFDEVARAGDCSKALVFSRYRAVPRALATLLSYEGERIAVERGTRGAQSYDYHSSAGRHGADEEADAMHVRRTDLRPLPRRSFRPRPGPNWCTAVAMFLPWSTAATIGDPLALAISHDGKLTYDDARASVRARLTERLGIAVSSRAPVPVWRWLSQLEPKEARQELEAAVAATQLLEGTSASLDVDHLPDAPTAAELDELAEIALAGPGPILTRCVNRIFGPAPADNTRAQKMCRVLLHGMRNYLDAHEFNLLLRGRSRGRDARYASALRKACWEGGLESVIDEMLCVESGLEDQSSENEADALDALFEALTLRDTRLDVSDLRPNTPPIRIRCHAAVPFGIAPGKQAEGAPRADNVRVAFNTPFRPMVLVTTSAGQEGLDFHRWAKHIVHWDLPSNAVDLEQRDGRLNRHGSLAVRQALARRFSFADFAQDRSPWRSIALLARQLEGADGLVPWWHLDGAKLRRTLIVPSLSEIERRCADLQHELDLYRLALGQPEQEAFLRTLALRLQTDDEPEKLRSWLREVSLDLRPPLTGEGASRR